VSSAPAIGNVEAGAVAQLFSLTVSVVSGGIACVAGALLLGALVPAVRKATLDPAGAPAPPPGPQGPPGSSPGDGSGDGGPDEPGGPLQEEGRVRA
jgi:hypothetical protein